MNPVIILGSSRSDGNTKLVVEILVKELNCPVIDLKKKEIGPFDYDQKYKGDNFIATFREIVENYDLLIFATPVYWYSMSGIMKNFFDRISDCLKWEKDLGRMLRGKSLAAISCGYDEKTVNGFHEPFEYSAKYLGMNYNGFLHTWVKDNSPVDPSVQSAIQAFGKKLKTLN